MSRQTQPYRRGPREGGSTLRSMLKGEPGSLPNPQDLYREGTQAQRRSTVLSPLLMALARRNAP